MSEHNEKESSRGNPFPNGNDLLTSVPSEGSDTKPDTGAKDKEVLKARWDLFSNKIVDLVTGAYLIYLAYVSFNRRSEVPERFTTLFIIAAIALFLAGLFFVLLAGKILWNETRKSQK